PAFIENTRTVCARLRHAGFPVKKLDEIADCRVESRCLSEILRNLLTTFYICQSLNVASGVGANGVSQDLRPRPRLPSGELNKKPMNAGRNRRSKEYWRIIGMWWPSASRSRSFLHTNKCSR